LPFALYGGYLALKEARQKKNYEFYLLIIWAVIFPLAFSFGRQKLHYFILPIYPATSLLVGLAADKIFKEPINLKISAALKYILIIATAVIVCFPLNIRSKRFIETVRLAPAIDELLKQLPEYEFMVYKQDKAALLFYSQQLTKVAVINNKASLEETLSMPYAKPRLCYLSEPDFIGLSPAAKENWQIVLRHKDRIIIVNPKNLELVITVP
jgi:4-amino-4-deoxy-L-arabinose transferase-like glycosyltransferase